MYDFIASLLQLNPTMLVTEEAACDAFVRARWRNGVIPCGHPACRAPCERQGAQLRCTGPARHRLTIFMFTPLGTKRRPNVRATLIALRLMATSARSISARELARETGMHHSTCWRHLQSLRAILPVPILHTPARVAKGALISWLNGTFRGVSRQWRHRYLQELASRWSFHEHLLDIAIAAFVVGASPITLKSARIRVHSAGAPARDEWPSAA